MKNRENLVLIADTTCDYSFTYLKTLINYNLILDSVLLINFSKTYQLSSIFLNPIKLLNYLRNLKTLTKNKIRELRIKNLARKYNIKFEKLKGKDFNSKIIVDSVTSYDKSAFIYTCGGRVPDNYFEDLKLKFIHVHSGFVPNFRGSDCLVWSVLIKNSITGTIFYMNSKIDRGDVIARFEIPFSMYYPTKWRFNYWKYLNDKLDLEIRSKFLASTLTHHKGGDFRFLPVKIQENDTTLDFLWIHKKLIPVVINILKHRYRNNFTTLDSNLESLIEKINKSND